MVIHLDCLVGAVGNQELNVALIGLFFQEAIWSTYTFRATYRTRCSRSTELEKVCLRPTEPYRLSGKGLPEFNRILLFGEQSLKAQRSLRWPSSISTSAVWPLHSVKMSLGLPVLLGQFDPRVRPHRGSSPKGVSLQPRVSPGRCVGEIL